MDLDPSCTDRINSFALVSYINDRLGEFLTELRGELVPGCHVPSHVTILPPRPIQVDAMEAGQSLRAPLESYSAFPIEIVGVDVFATTSVVYAELGLGRSQLRALHKQLNIGPLAFLEPHSYHPHITLAQNIEADIVPQVYEMARRRWAESAPGNTFVVEKSHFVQNTACNQWIDLMSYELESGLVPVPVRLA